MFWDNLINSSFEETKVYIKDLLNTAYIDRIGMVFFTKNFERVTQKRQ